MTSKTQTLEKDAKLLYGMFRVIYNFNADEIIDSAWPPAEDLIMNLHFKAKFKGLCDSEGFASANAVLRFAGALSSDNASKFCIALANKINS
jgi:hypothetical protein